MMRFFISIIFIQFLIFKVNCVNHDYDDEIIKHEDDDDQPFQNKQQLIGKEEEIPKENNYQQRREKFKKRRKFNKDGNFDENDGKNKFEKNLENNRKAKKRTKVGKNEKIGDLKIFKNSEMDPRNQPVSKSYSIVKTTKSELPKDEYYHHSIKYTDKPRKGNSNKKSKKHPKQEIEYVQKTPKKRKFIKNKKILYDDEESLSSKKTGNYIKPRGYGYGENDSWDDDEKYGDKRYEDEWYGNNRHRDEEHGGDWYGGKHHRDKGHGGDWYGDKHHKDEEHGYHGYGGTRYGDKWHGDKRYGGYGDTLYGDRWHGDTRYGDSHGLKKHYGEEIGKKHISDHKAKAGGDVSKGYEKEEGYDELQNDKHANEHKESEVSLKKGLKKGHVDQSKSRGEDYKGKEGEKGISVTKKGGHKKGKKTSGFHKVHKKDEYKKDIVFYDEAHDGGEHEEHEHEQEKHKEEGGAHGIKGHVDSAYNEEVVHKEGAKKKGEKFEEAGGHKREGGHEEHHDHQSEYEKEAKLKEGGKYGHLEGGVVEEGYDEEEEY